MPGMYKILTNSGTLFGINAGTYSMWKGNSYAAGDKKPTFARIMKAVGRAVNRGLSEEVKVLLPVAAWDLILEDQAALRRYAEKNQGEFVQGAESITFYGLNGKVVLEADRFMRESHIAIICPKHWHRIGSSDVSLKIAGSGEGDLVVQRETKNSFLFRSYSDTAIYCEAPALQVWCTGFDLDSAS